MAWNQYRRLLVAHPLKTKALTSSFITGLSDVCLQLYEQNSNRQLEERRGKQHHQHAVDDSTGSRSILDLKWSRTMTLAAVGLVYSGPINHLWFATLEKLVRIQHQVGSVALKLIADQVLFVPVVISGYLTVRGVFERKSELEIRAQLQEKVALATKAAWQFWPFVNLVAFSVVPVMYRVLFGNMCAIWWNARLSFISAQRSETTAEHTKAVVLSEQPQQPLWPLVSQEFHEVKLACGSLVTALMQQLVTQCLEELGLEAPRMQSL